MLSNFGISSLLLTLTLSLMIIYYSFLDLKISNQTIRKKIYKLSLFQITLTILSLITLIVAYINSDFSLTNVYENSHTAKPLFYKISGAWGNHEGSLLLWITILVLFSFLFLIYNSNHEKQYRLYTLIFQNFLIVGFLFFLLLTSNPFNSLFPIPTEGLGLNPILQDPALAIHPPLLYVGFVGCSIYFSAAMASLVSRYEGKLFAKSIKTWVRISWCFQTLGIIVGSIWAYYELGWGGFWFWDPVENASLLPWFAISALMHSVIVLEKRDTLYSWVILLCLLTFTLSVMGTFLVRSGILNSVHTFASDPTRGTYILSFLSLMIFSSLIIFYKNYKKKFVQINLQSKEFYILVNNWFMVFFLFTVFIGIIYPIFLDVITQAKISVGPPFYNIIIIPLVVPFLFLMAIGPQSKWIKHRYTNLYKFLLLFLVSIVMNFLIYFIFGSYSLLSNLIFISSIFLIIHSAIDTYQLVKKKVKFEYPRIISHLGFGLLVFFIGINHHYSIEKDFNLKLGESKKFDKYEIYFEALNMKQHNNYKAIVGSFKLINIKNNSIDFLNPEIRIYSNPETLTYEASIETKLTKDIYLTMSNITRSEYYNIKFQDKPFMIWIWISALIIVLGGSSRILGNKKNEN
jgi:cytochrome c-type biogenesis protein CcmF